jgi:hypothetical protein
MNNNNKGIIIMNKKRCRVTLRLDDDVISQAKIMLTEASKHQGREIPLNFVVNTYLREITNLYFQLPKKTGHGTSIIGFIGKYLDSDRVEKRAKTSDA